MDRFVHWFRTRTPGRLRLWCGARANWTLRVLLVLTLLLVAVLLVVPTPATAATCADSLPFTNVAACLDGMQYDLWRTATATAWIGPTLLLQATYYVGALRGLLVGTVFAGVYSALGAVVNQVFVAILTLALLCWGVLQLALPLLQRHYLNLQHILTWGLLTPLLITFLGPAFGTLDGIRVSLGGAFFSTAFTEADGRFFGPTAGTPLTLAPLYPSSACGGAPLTRPPGTVTGTTFLDDLAAALLYADAQDIHCPEENRRESPSRPADLPRRFYTTPPGYAYAAVSDPRRIDRVGEIEDAGERQAALANIQAGLTRVLMSSIPAGLALVEALVQLLLSLSLVIVWFSLPIVGLVMVFQQDAGPILVLLQRAVKILQVTLMTSILLGIVTALLVAAATVGGPLAFIALAMVGHFLVIYLAFTALAVLWDSLLALRDSVTIGTGTNPTAPVTAAMGTVVMAGGAALTGGATLAGAAATGLVAAHSSGSATTGVAAGLGRIKPLMQVGDVAAGMGPPQDGRDALFAGFAAGDLARRRGIGAMQRSLRADADARTDRLTRQRDALFEGDMAAAQRRGLPEDPRADSFRTQAQSAAPPPAAPAAPPPPAPMPERQQEQVTAQVSLNWEQLRDQVTFDTPTPPVLGPSEQLLPTSPERVVLDAPGAPPPTPAATLQDMTDQHLRNQTGVVEHGMQELTATLRDGMREVSDALRDDTRDPIADEATASADLAWELEANSDRDTLRQTLEQAGQRERNDTHRMTQGMQTLSSVLREQVAQEAVRAATTAQTAVAASARVPQQAALSDPGATPAASAPPSSPSDTTSQAGITQTIASQHPTVALRGAGADEPPHRDSLPTAPTIIQPQAVEPTDSIVDPPQTDGPPRDRPAGASPAPEQSPTSAPKPAAPPPPPPRTLRPQEVAPTRDPAPDNPPVEPPPPPRPRSATPPTPAPTPPAATADSATAETEKGERV